MRLAARAALVLVQVTSAVIFLACGVQCAGESEYWDALSADDVIEEDLDHVWPNRYWEALHGHARCIPDYYGHCVPMELMNRICEFNRQADLGGWDNLGMQELQVHLHVEHGLRAENVSLSKVSPDESALGWNMIAQPTEEKVRMPCVRLSRYYYDHDLMHQSHTQLRVCLRRRDGAIIPCEMAAQWCRYAASSCAKADHVVDVGRP